MCLVFESYLLCYLVLRYLENNTELENSLKDIQMPSKEFGVLSIAGYSKFKNVFYLSSPPPFPYPPPFHQVQELRSMTGQMGLVGILAVIQNLEAR